MTLNKESPTRCADPALLKNDILYSILLDLGFHHVLCQYIDESSVALFSLEIDRSIG